MSVSVRLYLDQRTGGFIHHSSSICCQGSTEEGGAEVDGDTGEPGMVGGLWSGNRLQLTTYQIMKRTKVMH